MLTGGDEHALVPIVFHDLTHDSQGNAIMPPKQLSTECFDVGQRISITLERKTVAPDDSVNLSLDSALDLRIHGHC
jgi:hypothetical protein